MKVKLGDVFEIGSGGTPSKSHPEYYGGSIPWVKTGDLKTTYLYNVEDFITEEGLNNSSAKLYEPDTVLIAMYGATIGATSILKINACTNQACAAFKPNDKVKPEYLYYFLRSRKNEFIKDGVGGAQPNISAGYLKKVSMELPEINKQDKIIEILSKISEVVEIRKQELINLDNLIKARFVELFGTLDNPVQEFRKNTLKELCNKITDGKHGGCTQEEGTERYFVGAREIYDDEVHYDTAPEINVTEFEKDYKRCNIEIGDFLIVNTGATIGKSAIATDQRTEHTLLQKSVALLKVKRELLNPVFLKWCYRVNTKMYMVASASAQPNLLLSKINATEIYVPDIELQNQFADFVVQVDKSKFKYTMKQMIKNKYTTAMN